MTHHASAPTANKDETEIEIEIEIEITLATVFSSPGEWS